MTDYARGFKDCKKGIDAGRGESEEYLEGWGDRYAIEQNLTHRTEREDNEQ